MTLERWDKLSDISPRFWWHEYMSSWIDQSFGSPYAAWDDGYWYQGDVFTTGTGIPPVMGCLSYNLFKEKIIDYKQFFKIYLYTGPKLRSVNNCYCSFINIRGYQISLNKVKFLLWIRGITNSWKMFILIKYIICHFNNSINIWFWSIGLSAKSTKNWC